MYSKLIIIFLLVILVAIAGVGTYVINRRDFYLNLEMGTASPTPLPLDTTYPSPTPTLAQTRDKKAEINKTISIPITNAGEEIVSEIDYELTEYEFTDEIIVQGKAANAIEGRTFFIITVRIVNKHDQTVQLNTRDYVRISVDDSDLLAPDIHNDPVTIQSNSTHMTRLGFPMNEDQDKITIRLGNDDTEVVFIELKLADET